MFGLLEREAGVIVFVVVCAFAILKGGRVEQMGAGLLLVSWAASTSAQLDVGIFSTQYAVMAIDVVDFAIYSILAWRSDRSWPMWAAAFQAIEVAVHVARAAGLRISGLPYITAVNLSAYGVMGALLVGTIIAWREREALKGKPF
ncbi:MAG TPA: hypothetical protein VG407_16215 [Caulobacteraceae bacterium]|nr:hypothetical protein [Caulobacteraceae bacterium]